MQPSRFRPFGASLLTTLLVLGLLLPAQVLGNAEDVRAQQFRAEFGLRSDLAYVRSLVAAEVASDAFGVPLTEEEVAELTHRTDLEPKIAELQARLRTESAEFGGLYIDQGAGGIVDVAMVTSDLTSARSFVGSLADDAVAVRVRGVAFTEAELERLAARLTAERSFQVSLGTWANEIWPDVRTNRVQVGIDPYSRELVGALKSRYGSAIEVYAAPAASLTGCTNRNNCPGPPLRAGIRLYDAGCTSAFLGYYGYQGVYTDVMLSAGHCANLVPAGHVYQNPDNSNIGPMIKEVYANNSTADAMIIDITAPQASNRIYHTPTSWFPVFSIQQRSEEVIGMAVCQSARISDYTCGTLYAKDFSITYSDGTTLLNQRSATYAVALGDSGSGVFSANKAFGVQSGMNLAGRAIYSHISYVAALIPGLSINLN